MLKISMLIDESKGMFKEAAKDSLTGKQLEM